MSYQERNRWMPHRMSRNKASNKEGSLCLPVELTEPWYSEHVNSREQQKPPPSADRGPRTVAEPASRSGHGTNLPRLTQSVCIIELRTTANRNKAPICFRLSFLSCFCYPSGSFSRRAEAAGQARPNAPTCDLWARRRKHRALFPASLLLIRSFVH